MKTKKYFLPILAATVLMATGCDDNAFLKESPETFYTIENAFETTSQVEASVTSLYLKYRKLFYANNDYWMLKGTGTDVLDVSHFATATGGFSNFSNWTTTYGNTQTVYNGLYDIINVANLTLQGLETVQWGDARQKEQAIAQARFFRGLSYLNLGELFGGVPLTDTYHRTPKFDFVRSSRADTYEFAITDLEAAAAGLPDYPAEAGRVGKGATYHFLAEAYLAAATDKQNDTELLNKSVESANKVLGLHTLMTERFGSRAPGTNAPSESFSVTSLEGEKVTITTPALYEDGNVIFDLFQRGNLDREEGNTESLWVMQNNYESSREYKKDFYFNIMRAYGPVLRDVKWLPEYSDKETYGKLGPDGKPLEIYGSPWVTTNIDPVAYPGKDVCAYIGGRAVGRIEPTIYAKNGIWADSEGDLRNSEVMIRRKFVCLDRNHKMYEQVVDIENMCTPETQDRFWPIFTKIIPIDDWGHQGIENGENRTNIYYDVYESRAAETYLLRAEAYLRLGDKSKAAADVNTIRSRAKCDKMVSDGEIDLDYILDERARELIYEERRWNTLLRMEPGVATKRLREYSLHMHDYTTYVGPLNWDLWPIPQSAIDSNLDAVIDQNPGWN